MGHLSFSNNGSYPLFPYSATCNGRSEVNEPKISCVTTYTYFLTVNMTHLNRAQFVKSVHFVLH